MYMAGQTTIRISHATKEILDGLKQHPKESYEQVIGRLASVVCDNDPVTEEELADMQASLDDLKAGRVVTLKAARKELGL